MRELGEQIRTAKTHGPCAGKQVFYESVRVLDTKGGEDLVVEGLGESLGHHA
jgi:hypothetical protein